MKKNFDKNFDTVQVDSITGKYFVFIPEQIINDLSWYEDTEIQISLEGTEIIIEERN